MLSIILHSLILILGIMTFGYIVSIVTRTNAVADIFWGLGFVLVSWFTLYSTGTYLPRQLLTTLLVTLWGLRLSGYILYRNWGKGEDPRYEELANKWGSWFYLGSFLQIFMVQALMLFIIALPIIVINTSTTAGLFRFYDYFSVLLWMIGFAFEVIGDWQLNRFLSHPDSKNKIFITGIWRYTRHPNYFGEIIMWFSLYFLAIPVPYGIFTVISPLLLTGILFFVSLPATERIFEGNEEFQAYKKKTSAIIPLWY